MFKDVESQPDFPTLERRILKFWEEENSFGKLVEKNRGNATYSFIDGPITANNPMGVHHAWGRTYKDVFQRHRAMEGYDQRYQNGFDCQGLWVEVEVEKELKLNSKKEILDFGLETFARACRERVNKYAHVQTQQSKRLGQWMDWDHSYYTMDDSNIEHIWYFLKICFEKGLLFKGSSVMPWCLRCGTSLSQHELIDSYKEVTHPSLFIALPLKERQDEHFLVWTTTPWTLPANTALAVAPDLPYLLLERDGKRYWIARDAAQRLGDGFQTITEVQGKELLGLAYCSPFAELPVQAGVEHRVIPWDDVSGEEGTGIVHIAPGCGGEDFQLSKEHDLKVIKPIDEAGDYGPGFAFIEGVNVTEVEDTVVNSLKEKGYFFKLEDYTHRYPGCWRCQEDLVFRLEDEWFIEADKVREAMLENAREVHWQPEHAGKLMADWLHNMGDWCISRKRFWGLPLPFYQCSCGEMIVIGSKEELLERAVKPVPELPELHRPWIDEIAIHCPACGEKAHRVEEVGDCWLDAGIVPYSTLHYLNGEEGRKYWEKWFPADFVVEMREQIRLWFYAQLFMSTVLEDRPPYRKVMTYEKVHDEVGRPMHKSWGNAIWFDEAVEKMGADVMRYIYTSRNPNINLNFGYTFGEEVKRKLLTLWNVYSFFITYARLDGWQPREGLDQVTLAGAVDEGHLFDQWMLARVQEAIESMEQSLTAYDTVRAVRALDSLVEDVSRWYVRRNRRRFWKGDGDADKDQAYSVLYYTLVTTVRLMAPILPFLAEEMYQNLVTSVQPKAPESVHLTSYPQVHTEWQNKGLVEDMAVIMDACSLGHAARNQAGIKVRQPLARLQVAGPEKNLQALKQGIEIIKEEINVKEVELLAGEHDFFDYRVAPVFANIGKTFGPLVPKIKEALLASDGSAVKAKVEAGSPITLNLGPETVTLQPEDVTIQTRTREGIEAVEGENLVAALHTEITPALEREGLARDILRHIQTLRKEGGLEVDTRIRLYCQGEGLLKETLEEYGPYIAREVLAEDLQMTEEIQTTIRKELELQSLTLILGIEPVR